MKIIRKPKFVEKKILFANKKYFNTSYLKIVITAGSKHESDKDHK